MNADDQIPMPNESLDLVAAENSVDDFIRELEEKEKDLMIAADMTIEVEETPDPEVPDYMVAELTAADVSRPVSPATKVRNFELESENAALKVRLLELKAERNDIQQKSDRRLKDFENFKYRMDRERRGAFIDQIANLASQMLPVLDNIERAIDSAERLDAKKTPDFEQFFHGIVLVNQQMNEVLVGMGVQPISTVGESFDPNFHEAVAMDVESDLPPNTVSQEMLRGYRIGNRVVRHSMVRVTPAAVRDAALQQSSHDNTPSETEDE